MYIIIIIIYNRLFCTNSISICSSCWFVWFCIHIFIYLYVYLFLSIERDLCVCLCVCIRDQINQVVTNAMDKCDPQSNKEDQFIHDRKWGSEQTEAKVQARDGNAENEPHAALKLQIARIPNVVWKHVHSSRIHFFLFETTTVYFARFDCIDMEWPKRTERKHCTQSAIVKLYKNKQ